MMNSSPGATRIRLVPAGEWASVARSSPQFNFQQSPSYSLELAEKRGASCEFIDIIDAEQQIVGAASVRVRTIPLLGGGIAYISAGPLSTRPLSGEGSGALRGVIDALVTEYVARRRLCLRVALPPAEPAVSSLIAEALTESGFEPATTNPAYRTILVDLRPPLDDIRATLGRKWRNQLSAALRGAVTVEMSREPDAVARFTPLLEETIQRKGFTTELGASFYDGVQRRADAEDRMLVAIAKENDRDVAGVVASVVGQTAVYVLGATTALGMQNKAAYALHWRVMEAARAAGCHWYDLGGIDPERNPGVHHFKSGFGGQDIVLPGPFEIRPPGFAGIVSRFAERSYASLKRWRS